MCKKSIIAIFAVALLALVACQATPEDAIIVGKDTERLIEQAGSNGESNPQEITPDKHYSAEMTGANGKLRIHVDADIITPDVDSMPVAKVSMGLFTQEQVTGMFNYLFPNEKPKQDFGQVETKADVEKEILWLKQKLANGDYAGSEESIKHEISEMEKIYKSAPSTAPEGGASDGTLTQIEGDSSTARVLSVSNSEAKLSINTHTHVEGMSGMNLPGLTYKAKNPAFVYTTRNMVRYGEEEFTQIAKNNLKITLEEAQALCDGLFTAAGYKENEFVAGDVFIIDDTGADEKPGSHFAYHLVYTRLLNDCPVFFDRTGLMINKDESFSLPWSYEHIEFIIDDSGFVSIDWLRPIDIGEAVENKAALKSYDEIISVFETMMKRTYEGFIVTVLNGTAELDITVDNIELCLLRIRERGASQTDGLLIPAWIFSGYNKCTGSDGEIKYLQGAAFYSAPNDEIVAVEGAASNNALDLIMGTREAEPVTLMAINAIDGSIIDLNKGY